MTLTAPGDLDRHVGRYYGKHRGTVTDNADPLKRGRVKVRVPSVFGPDLEVWATPCFASGHFFVPPVDAAVFVEFEAGDPQHPLWVGTWHPEGTVPERAEPDAPEVRLVHTPSGHALEMRDVEGEEKVVLRHKGDAFVSLDENGSVLAADSGGAFVYLNADSSETTVASRQGHFVVLSDGGITLVHQDGTRIELAGGKANVVAAGGVTVASSGSVNLSGSSILLGGSLATMSIVVAEKFLPFYAAHSHVTPFGPTGPPLPPVAPPLISSTGVKVTP